MVPVWVKFPNLPLQCWSLKCLSKIVSVLRKPVQSDMLTHTMSRLSYARVLVEINLLSDLPYSIDIKLPNGSLLKQQVIYETLPRFCKQCRILGHLTSTCPKSIPLADPSKQAAKVSAKAPRASTVKESVFDRLGPQEEPLVVVSPVGNLPLNSSPLLAEPEQSKRLRRKNSPSKQRGRSSTVAVSGAVDHCSVHESSTLHAPLHAPVHPTNTSKDHRLPSHPAANTNVLAGSRKDKGKAVVVSVDVCHQLGFLVHPYGDGGLSRAMLAFQAGLRGCFPPPFLDDNPLLERQRVEQPSETT
ncbi:hypothetical protein NC653_027589 [Populus alba x Populus x berolinensis]|nr:hypothetical protein NC653_027589 [Populus alba x Populus x berolinensis]